MIVRWHRLAGAAVAVFGCIGCDAPATNDASSDLAQPRTHDLLDAASTSAADAHEPDALDLGVNDDLSQPSLSDLAMPPDFAGPFETDTSPVDIRDYWPVFNYKAITYRRVDGTLYEVKVIKTADPMATWEPAASPGEVHFSREDYIPTLYAPIGGDPAKDPVAYFNNSWSMVKRPDWSVSEIADSFALRSDCTSWCASKGQVYVGGDIAHGRPGGHVLGENYYYEVDVPMNWSPNIQTTAPTALAGYSVSTIIRMEAKFNAFTPEYGRHSGSWGPSNGRTYGRAVRLVMQHGTAGSPDYPSNGKTCSNMPSSITHRARYTSFWVYDWYAPDIGLVKETLLFDERSCEGAMAPASGKAVIDYDNYVDEDW
ncbi:MAG: hypothetical protein PVSMB1_04670 [Gemmatimonadaceae bacterium]